LGNFEELGVRPDLVKGLTEMKIINPSRIQSDVIPLLINTPTDLVGQAPTGTGKTAAYGLPLLHKIRPEKKVVQGLILCPTRELGQQIAKQLFKFTKYSERIFTEAVYGGPQIERQIQALQRPTHIVVATPGRLIDLVKRNAIDLSNVKTVVLDEADEMLSMGFKRDLDTILSFLTDVESKWLFSATIPDGIKQIVNKHMSKNAHRIQVSKKNAVNKNIEHLYFVCEEKQKFNYLMKFLESQKGERGLIFCRTKEVTKDLMKKLKSHNISADAIHGDLLQKERDKAMRAFKNESIQVLVATDLAARGIDVAGLTYVLHYQPPGKEEYYTHRSGRTARAGNRGVSLSIVTTEETRQLRYFEKKLSIAFKQVRKL
jgi:ATP-dependent RNA helicase DeaD